MEALRARFERAERLAVQEPVDVNGEVLFNAGRRETDPNTGIERYVGGDIDERYAFYVWVPHKTLRTPSSTILWPTSWTPSARTMTCGAYVTAS